MEQANKAARYNFARMARNILSCFKPERLRPDEFDGAFDELEKSADQLAAAYTGLKRAHIHAARGRAGAARLLNHAYGAAEAAQRHAYNLKNRLSTSQERCRNVGRVVAAPNLSDVMLDLEALARDFPEVAFEDGAITVLTDSIVLSDEGEEFDFGEFRIKLFLSSVAAMADEPYELEACDPHYNPSGEFVHPHVTGSHLCAGDGKGAAITAARAGRYYDFFVIVNQIISTYNPSSPYAELVSWIRGHEYICYSCEEGLSDGDRFSCENCGEMFCDSCSSYCDVVDVSYCTNCIENERCECDHIGESGCLCHENPACISCEEVVSDHDSHQCQHMYVAHRYGGGGRGRTTHTSICHSCADAHSDERRPCMVSHWNPETQVRVEERCTHFGERHCALVLYSDLEEGTEPQEEEASAATETSGATSES